MQPFDGADGGAGPEAGFVDPAAPAQPPPVSPFEAPLPAAFGGGEDAKTAAYTLLSQLQEASGLDLAQLLTEPTQQQGPTATRVGVQVPGEGLPPGLGLSEQATDELANELCDLVDRYQRVTERQMNEETEIREAYNMAGAVGAHSPGTTSDETLVSEVMMVQVDQITARLVTNITSVQPFIRVDPVKGDIYDAAEHKKLAKSTEAFLCQYLPNEVDFRHLMPAAIHRLVKVGTAVVRAAWEEEDREVGFYLPDSSVEHTEVIRTAGVRARLIENRLAIIWPPTCLNWQRDYEVVGHESWHSRSSWRELAGKWEVPDEVRKQVEASPGERSNEIEKKQQADGLDHDQMEGQRLLDPQVKLTELWCHLWLPTPYRRRVKFQVILHRPTRKILWSDLNTHFTRKHPYFPLRYKWGDLSAWGKGVGHEALNCWAADTALWQLSMENLAAGAFNIVIRNAASAHNTQSRPVRPGMEVTSMNPENDFIVRSMGGDAADLPAARQENEQRLKKATGVPDVAMGMGDETMKSGAGTGSTLALIEQAGMKIRFVDQTIREDLSDLSAFVLELCCQYGDEGIFYNAVGPSDASTLERLRYVPPRGKDIPSMFRVQAMAPSAATSTEARRNNYMVIWGFASQAVQVMNDFVTPLLQQQNPAGLPRWQYAMAQTLHEIMRRVLELHELPGLMSLMPEGLPETTPADQQINMLNAQLQEAYGMVEQLQSQLQQLLPPQEEPAPEEAGAGRDGGSGNGPSAPAPLEAGGAPPPPMM